MENKPTIQDSNNKAIRRFFGMYEKQTKEELSSFLFELSLLSIIEQAEIPLSTSQAATLTVNFKLLHNLISDLQKPEE